MPRDRDPPTRRRTGRARPRAARRGRSPRCARACRRSPTTTVAGDHRRGAQLRGRAARRRWARTSATPCSSRSAASSPWPAGRRGADPRTPDRAGGRGRLPARPGRGPQRPHHRGAARGVPDRRPGLLARDVDDRGARGRATPRRWPTSPSWSSPTSTSCPRPASPGTPTSWPPPAGCAQRLLERVASHLLDGAPAETVQAAAERAGWEPPTTLTAVLVPESQVRPVLRRAPGRHAGGRRDLPDLEDGALLLVPDAHGRPPGPPCCARSPTAAPSPGRRGRGWRCARPYDRALRARAPGHRAATPRPR